MTYVHKYVAEDRMWCVGYWTSQTLTGGMSRSEFHSIRDCGSSDEAAAFVNYLNGGNGDVFMWIEKTR